MSCKSNCKYLTKLPSKYGFVLHTTQVSFLQGLVECFDPVYKNM